MIAFGYSEANHDLKNVPSSDTILRFLCVRIRLNESNAVHEKPGEREVKRRVPHAVIKSAKSYSIVNICRGE